MSPLVEFLLARIAEDEAAAMNAIAAIGDDGHWFGSPANLQKVFSVTLTEVARSAVPRHIARHDPARVLAECEAKRRIVAFSGPEKAADDALLARFVDPSVDQARLAETEPFLRQSGLLLRLSIERVMKFLALPYADHPEYREEWRP